MSYKDQNDTVSILHYTAPRHSVCAPIIIQASSLLTESTAAWTACQSAYQRHTIIIIKKNGDTRLQVKPIISI